MHKQLMFLLFFSNIPLFTTPQIHRKNYPLTLTWNETSNNRYIADQLVWAYPKPFFHLEYYDHRIALLAGLIGNTKNNAWNAYCDYREETLVFPPEAQFNKIPAHIWNSSPQDFHDPLWNNSKHIAVPITDSQTWQNHELVMQLTKTALNKLAPINMDLINAIVTQTNQALLSANVHQHLSSLINLFHPQIDRWPNLHLVWGPTYDGTCIGYNVFIQLPWHEQEVINQDKNITNKICALIINQLTEFIIGGIPQDRKIALSKPFIATIVPKITMSTWKQKLKYSRHHELLTKPIATASQELFLEEALDPQNSVTKDAIITRLTPQYKMLLKEYFSEKKPLDNQFMVKAAQIACSE